MRFKCLLAICLSLATAAVIAAPDVPFTEEAFAPYKGDGPANLDGEAFLKTEKGEVRNCSGETVLLAPGTQYDINVLNRFAFSFEVALMWAKDAKPYWRDSICDSQGKFNFQGVPEGSWFVITQVQWKAMGYGTQGGTVIQKVTLKPGQNRVILSQKNMRPMPFGWDFK